MMEAEALGLQRDFPVVGPKAVLGMGITPYAAELGQLTVWIGEIAKTRFCGDGWH